jgi:hypothetical protein
VLLVPTLILEVSSLTSCGFTFFDCERAPVFFVLCLAERRPGQLFFLLRTVATRIGLESEAFDQNYRNWTVWFDKLNDLILTIPTAVRDAADIR